MRQYLLPLFVVAAFFLAWAAFHLWRVHNLTARTLHRLRQVRQFVSDLTMPLANIAAELRRANNLKELEMSERLNPRTGERDPIIIVTEPPGRNDTEVFFEVEPEAHGIEGMRRKFEQELGE